MSSADFQKKPLITHHRSGLSWPTLCCWLGLAAGSAVGSQSLQQAAFGDPEASTGIRATLDEWRANRTSYSLTERFESLSKVVATGHPDALAAVIKELSAKDSPKHQDKLLELISPLTAKQFGSKHFEDQWIELFVSKEFSKISLNHCWLANCVFRAWILDGRAPAVQNFALNDAAPVAYRMAALEAISSLTYPSTSFMDAILLKLPNVSADVKGRFLEKVAKTVQSAVRLNPPPARLGKSAIPGIQGLISQLDEAQIPLQSIRRVSRIVAEIVGSKTIFRNAESWRAYLDGQKTAEKLTAEGYAVADEPTQYFFGVPGYGLKTCYVVDLSGSMDLPLDTSGVTVAEKPNSAKKSGPTTGEPEKGSQNSNDAKPPVVAPPDSTPFPGLEGLPLKRIKTRLDAAKEALKASIRALPQKGNSFQGAKFSIVVFGDEGKILGDPNKMVEATPTSVQAICAAIDRLSCGGHTNLHRGLELAFSIGESSVQKPGSMLPISGDDPDDVYVLSDGAANQDSYTFNKTGVLKFLYQDDENLANSVLRANLFTDAKLHLISIGRQDDSSLPYMSKATRCEFIQLGK